MSSNFRKPRKPKKLTVKTLELFTWKVWCEHRNSFEVPRKDFAVKENGNKVHFSLTINLEKLAPHNQILNQKLKKKVLKEIQNLEEKKKIYHQDLQNYRKEMSEWRRKKKLKSFA